MGAPAKSTGGVQSAKDAPGRRTRGSGRGEGASSRSEGAGRLARADTPILSTKARPSRKQEGHPPDRPPRGRSGGLPKPPQGHSGYRRKVQRKPPRQQGTAPTYTNQNSKELMLAAARRVATERGYEAMRITEITDPIGVTRQAFYAHFRDKRHCMAEAIDPKLGAIERMAASLSESDEEAAARIAHVLDDLICERYSSAEGTRARIVEAMITLLRRSGSFHKVRIGPLVKQAHVPPGDFYRQFTGKAECFAVAYERLLGELVAAVHEECPAEHTRHDLSALFGALAAALDADPERRHILVVEMAHLPDEAPEDVDGARRTAFRGAIAELLSASTGLAATDPRLSFASASVLELIRSVELGSGDIGLGERLATLAEEYVPAVLAEGRAPMPAAA